MLPFDILKILSPSAFYVVDRVRPEPLVADVGDEEEFEFGFDFVLATGEPPVKSSHISLKPIALNLVARVSVKTATLFPRSLRNVEPGVAIEQSQQAPHQYLAPAVTQLHLAHLLNDFLYLLLKNFLFQILRLLLLDLVRLAAGRVLRKQSPRVLLRGVEFGAARQLVAAFGAVVVVGSA